MTFGEPVLSPFLAVAQSGVWFVIEGASKDL